MSYTFVVNDDNVSLYNLVNGNKITIFSDDPRYEKFKELIMLGSYEDAELLDAKVVLEKFSGEYRTSARFSVQVVDGVGIVKMYGNEYPLSQAIVNRIIKMESEGFRATPLVLFLENLFKNPSKTAVDELYLFLEATDLPITEDGCFIAYKIVRNNYMDVYSGKMDNSVGKTVEMPRFAVDDKRNNTCSAGLHFCSKGYLSSYGSNGGDDRCVLVKINPEDVVSIPSDYNNAKGRCCKYVVVGEVEDKNWKTNLPEKDYNETTVVAKDGSTLREPAKALALAAEPMWFVFDRNLRRWRDGLTGLIVSRAAVAANKNVTLEEVIKMEINAK